MSRKIQITRLCTFDLNLPFRQRHENGNILLKGKCTMEEGLLDSLRAFLVSLSPGFCVGLWSYVIRGTDENHKSQRFRPYSLSTLPIYKTEQTSSRSMSRQFALLTAVLIILIILIVQIRSDVILKMKIRTVSKSKRTETHRRFNSFVNRWQSKFHDSSRDGYLFFKHIRKAGKKKRYSWNEI